MLIYVDILMIRYLIKLIEMNMMSTIKYLEDYNITIDVNINNIYNIYNKIN